MQGLNALYGFKHKCNKAQGLIFYIYCGLKCWLLCASAASMCGKLLNINQKMIDSNFQNALSSEKPYENVKKRQRSHNTFLCRLHIGITIHHLAGGGSRRPASSRFPAIHNSSKNIHGNLSEPLRNLYQKTQMCASNFIF